MSNIVFSHDAIMNVLLGHHRLPITNDTDKSLKSDHFNYLIIDPDSSIADHIGLSDTLREYNIVDFPTIDSTQLTPSTSPEEHSEIFEPQIPDLENVEEDSQIASLVGIRNYMLDCIKQRNEESNYNIIFHEGLKYLGQVIKDTHVTSLNLSWNRIECDLLINIAQNLLETKIKSLDISGNKIGQKGMTYLESVLGDTQISSFQASYNTEEFDYVNAIRQCKESTKLATLELVYSNKRVKSHGLEYVAPILKDSPITVVNLCGSEINSEQLRLFVPSLVGTNITSLDLSYNTPGFDGISCLARTLKDTQINSLSLDYNQLDSETLQMFARCLVDTKITSLDLIGNDISYDAMNCLIEALKNSQIISISLSTNRRCCLNCDIDVFEIFASCLKDTKINKLHLKGHEYQLSSDSINYLSQVLKYTQITTICLEQVYFYTSSNNSECLQIFVSCLKDTKVTSLTLSLVNLDYNLTTCLAETLKDTQITSFVLCRTEMSYELLQIFASCLVDTKITSLGLYSNNLGYDGMKCLAQFLKYTQITTLDLCKNYNGRTNVESFQAFALCLADTKITSLNLSENQLCIGTPDGISYLVSVLSNTQITHLNISNNLIECNSLKNLILHLPDTKITALDISGNNICCNAFYLASILKKTHITTLNLSSNIFEQSNYTPTSELCTALRMEKMDCIGSLYYFAVAKPTIKSLIIRSSTLDYEGMKYISQGLLGSDIVELDLSDNSIDSNGFRCLARAIRNTQINSLNLSKNKISCSDVKYLLLCLEGSQVKSLDLSCNSIGDKGIEHIANSLDHNKILELDLYGNNIERKSAYQLCESVESCKRNILVRIGLKDEVFPHSVDLVVYHGVLIEINKPNIEFGVANSLKNAYKNKAITKIIYRGGYNYLSGAFDNINISEVELSCLDENIATAFKKGNIALLNVCRPINKMNEDYLSQINFKALRLQEIRHLTRCYPTCRVIKSAIVNNNIMYLDLSNLNLGKCRFKQLVSKLKNSEIISLNISNNKLGADAVKLLAEVLPNTRITYIDLHGNNIGYIGFISLKNVVEKTDICWISLGDNNIEKNFPEGVNLSPYIVPRKNTPIAFQMRYLFVQLVSLNNEEFEFIIPCEQTELDIKDYPRLVKNVLEIRNSKMHIYDIIYMMNKRHDIELLNKIDRFVGEIRERFSTFIGYKWTDLEQSFGYASFVDLVKECEALKMDDFVECLLLHRVLFYVNDEQNILHPYIYKMLHKYGMPLFNEDLEPHKKEHIVDYYHKHPEIDGVPEIIDLLSLEPPLNRSKLN